MTKADALASYIPTGEMGDAVMDLFFPAPDWQNPDRYTAVSEVDRAGLAWEFVRRDPHYRDIVISDEDIGDRASRVTILPDEPPPLDAWGLSFR